MFLIVGHTAVRFLSNFRGIFAIFLTLYPSKLRFFKLRYILLQDPCRRGEAPMRSVHFYEKCSLLKCAFVIDTLTGVLVV